MKDVKQNIVQLKEKNMHTRTPSVRRAKGMLLCKEPDAGKGKCSRIGGGVVNGMFNPTGRSLRVPISMLYNFRISTEAIN